MYTGTDWQRDNTNRCNYICEFDSARHVERFADILFATVDDNKKITIVVRTYKTIQDLVSLLPGNNTFQEDLYFTVEQMEKIIVIKPSNLKNMCIKVESDAGIIICPMCLVEHN